MTSASTGVRLRTHVRAGTAARRSLRSAGPGNLSRRTGGTSGLRRGCGASDRLSGVGEFPDTRYARTDDGGHIAFQVVGDGPPDLVFLPEALSHIEMIWEMPRYASLLRRLASFSRLVLFEPRGSGLSDPLGRDERPSLEVQAEDLLSVLDTIGSNRPALVANNLAGLLAIFFAATYPSRISSLVLDGCYARFAARSRLLLGCPNRSSGTDHLPIRCWYALLAEQALKYTAPNAARDPEFVAQWRRRSRSTYGPGVAKANAELAMFSDLRPLLPAIQAPTLVLCRANDSFAGPPHARYLAENVPNAKLVELAGDDNLIYVGDSDKDLDEIEEFLTGAVHAPRSSRVLATVLFTDIVSSTEHLAALGDRKWHEVLNAHDLAIRRQLERFQGREVGTRRRLRRHLRRTRPSHRMCMCNARRCCCTGLGDQSRRPHR